MSRAAILATIRQSLGRGELDTATSQRLEQRLQQPTVTLQPQLTNNDLVTLFQQQLEQAAGTVVRVRDRKAAVAAIKAYLQARDLPLQLVADRRLQALPWFAGMTVVYRNAEASDQVSVTQGFAGIAETGSVLMLSSVEAPTPLNFLPEVHIVVLRAVDVVSHIESVWQKLRARGKMPRAVNLITGPSRTADIEQTIQLGAHGPRAFHVVLLM